LAALAKKKRAEEKRAEGKAQLARNKRAEEKEKLAKQKDQDEHQAFIDSRIKAEKEALRKSPLTVKSEKDYLDFVDNTSKFKGRIVKMIGVSYDAVRPLREMGPSINLIPFKTPAHAGNHSLLFEVTTHDRLNRFKSYDDLPNIRSFGLVTVFFYCEEGKLRSGNRVTFIERDE
jgi:hypothetical protein